MLQKSNKDLLEGSLERVSRILTDRFDIKVHFCGRECATDNRAIYLPSVPEDCSEKLYNAMQGYLDHESAHIIFDDFSLNGIEIKDVEFTPLLTMWFKIMIDLKSEQKMTEIWPGSRTNLDNAHEFVLEEELLPFWHKLSFITRYTRAALFYGKGHKDFFDLIPDGPELLDKLGPIKPALKLAKRQPDALHALALANWVVNVLGKDPELSQVDPTITSALEDALEEVSEQIRRLVEEGEESDDEFSFGGIGGPSGGSEEDSEAEDEDPALEDDEEDSSSGIACGEAEEEADGEVGETSADDDAEEDGSGPEEEYTSKRFGEVKAEFDVDPSTIKAEEEKLSGEMSSAITSGVASYKHYRTTSDHDYYLPYDTSQDVIDVVDDGDKVQFQDDLKSIQNSSGVMLRTLRASLLAKTQCTTQYDKTLGTLNSRAYPRLILTGYNRVCKQKKTGESFNNRLLLLMDQSGSMSWSNKDEYARKAGVLFGEFGYQLGIPFAMMSFTTVSFGMESDRYFSVDEKTRLLYTRWGNLELNIYKKFHEPWRKVGHRLSHMVAKRHNYDGESVLFAAKQLLLAARPGERLILLVFSDGYPEQAISQYQPHHQRHLFNVVQRVTRAGVECIGIGICSDSVKEYYPDWIVINDPSELEAAQLQKLKEIFLGGKKKVIRPGMR